MVLFEYLHRLAGTPVPLPLYTAIRQTVDLAKIQLRYHVKYLSGDQSIKARKFLDSLAYEVEFGK